MCGVTGLRERWVLESLLNDQSSVGYPLHGTYQPILSLSMLTVTDVTSNERGWGFHFLQFVQLAGERSSSCGLKVYKNTQLHQLIFLIIRIYLLHYLGG